MDEEEFFKKHSIKDEDLEELPVRFRDASIHYYNRKQGIFYSKSINRDEWYISSACDQLLAFVTDDTEYKKRVKTEKEIEQSVQKKIEKAKEENMLIDKLDTIKYILTKEFIDEIIKNYLYDLICFNNNYTKSKIIDPIEYKIRSENCSKDHIFFEFNKLTLFHPGDIFSYPEVNIKNFNIIYDLESEQPIYVQFNNTGRYLQITNNTLIPCESLCSDNIKFYEKDENGSMLLIISSDKFKYKGLVLKKELINKLYNTKLKVINYNHFVYWLDQGIMSIEKDKSLIQESIDNIIKNNSKDNVLILSNKLINDIIDREFYSVMYDFNPYTNSSNPMIVSIEESIIKHARIVNRLNKVKYDINHVYQYTKSIKLDVFDIVYDFEYENNQQIYVEYDKTGEYSPIDKNFILDKQSVSKISKIDFYIKDELSEDMKLVENMTFKGMFLDTEFKKVFVDADKKNLKTENI
jgi:hypothetical protein